MPIDIIALEKAIKRAIPITHLEIQDQSSGCGESYSIVLVSEVSSHNKLSTMILHTNFSCQDFEGKSTLVRHRKGTLSLIAIPNDRIQLTHLVNEFLKEQIAQMHAFSQVNLLAPLTRLWT